MSESYNTRLREARELGQVAGEYSLDKLQQTFLRGRRSRQGPVGWELNLEVINPEPTGSKPGLKGDWQ